MSAKMPQHGERQPLLCHVQEDDWDRGELPPEVQGGTAVRVPEFAESVATKRSRYSRLCTLVIREGTKKIAEYVKQNLPSGERLETLLQKTYIQDIFVKLRKSRAILETQYKNLYPEGGARAREEDIDLSLWVILARNLTLDRGRINWNKSPGEFDDFIQHHILRIKEVRNNLNHVSSNELSEFEFNKMWTTVATALRRLGTTEEELDHYKTLDLDPETTRACVYEVKQQGMEDLCGHLQLEASQKHSLMIWLAVLVALLIFSFVVIITMIIIYSQKSSCGKFITAYKTTEAVIYYMARAGWGAKEPNRANLARFHGPVDLLIVSHTGFVGACRNNDDCCHMVQVTQRFNMDPMPEGSGFADIAFSYLIGGDGVIYEGRANFWIPATAKGYNTKSIGIGYVGKFDQVEPTSEAIEAGPALIQWLVDTGVLSRNTTVVGLCQVRGEKFPKSPGIKLLNLIAKWRGNGWAWRPWNTTLCEGFHPSTHFEADEL